MARNSRSWHSLTIIIKIIQKKKINKTRKLKDAMAIIKPRNKKISRNKWKFYCSQCEKKKFFFLNLIIFYTLFFEWMNETMKICLI